MREKALTVEREGVSERERKRGVCVRGERQRKIKRERERDREREIKRDRETERQRDGEEEKGETRLRHP